MELSPLFRLIQDVEQRLRDQANKAGLLSDEHPGQSRHSFWPLAERIRKHSLLFVVNCLFDLDGELEHGIFVPLAQGAHLSISWMRSGVVRESLSKSVQTL